MFGDKCKDYNLDDTRMMGYEKRFMITTNILEPKVFLVTKIVDVAPKGLIKFTFKQQEFDPKRDNAELLICNYYNDSGEIQVKEPEPHVDPTKTSTIYYLEKQPDGSLIKRLGPVVLKIGSITEYVVEVSTMEKPRLEWRTEITYHPTEDVNLMTDEKKNYYCNLLKLTEYDDGSVGLRVGKAKALIGTKYSLYVKDGNGDYYSTIELEVVNA